MSARQLKKPRSKWNDDEWEEICEIMPDEIVAIEDLHVKIQRNMQFQTSTELRSKKWMKNLISRELTLEELVNHLRDIETLSRECKHCKEILDIVKTKPPKVSIFNDVVEVYEKSISRFERQISKLQENSVDAINKLKQKQENAAKAAESKKEAERAIRQKMEAVFEITKKTTMNRLNAARDALRDRLYPEDNLTTFTNGMFEAPMISDEEALRLLRQRSLMDAIEVQKDVAKAAKVEMIEAPSTVGELNSMLKKGVLAAQTAGTAVVNGAEVLVGETVDSTVDAVVWTLGGVVLGPLELVSMAAAGAERVVLAARLRTDKLWKEAQDYWKQAKGWRSIPAGLGYLAAGTLNVATHLGHMTCSGTKNLFDMRNASIAKKMVAISLAAVVITTLLILTPFTLGFAAVPLAMILAPSAVAAGTFLLQGITSTLKKAWNKFSSGTKLKLTTKEEHGLLLWERLHPEKAKEATGKLAAKMESHKAESPDSSATVDAIKQEGAVPGAKLDAVKKGASSPSAAKRFLSGIASGIKGLFSKKKEPSLGIDVSQGQAKSAEMPPVIAVPASVEVKQLREDPSIALMERKRAVDQEVPAGQQPATKLPELSADNQPASKTPAVSPASAQSGRSVAEIGQDLVNVAANRLESALPGSGREFIPTQPKGSSNLGLRQRNKPKISISVQNEEPSPAGASPKPEERSPSAATPSNTARDSEGSAPDSPPRRSKPKTE